MADKRMFSKKIIDSDAFLDMSPTAQNLYFHLCMRADDDGFVNNPNSIRRTVGASEDDFKILLAKRFLLKFESGVIVIKHWRMHNVIQKDRYKPTVYQNELSKLIVKDNKSYTDDLNYVAVSTLVTECIQNGNEMETQYSIVKDRIDKNNNYTIQQKNLLIPDLQEIKNYIKENNYTFSAVKFRNYYNKVGWNNVDNWQRLADKWNLNELTPEPPKRKSKNKFNNFNQRTDEIDESLLIDNQ